MIALIEAILAPSEHKPDHHLRLHDMLGWKGPAPDIWLQGILQVDMKEVATMSKWCALLISSRAFTALSAQWPRFSYLFSPASRATGRDRTDGMGASEVKDTWKESTQRNFLWER